MKHTVSFGSTPWGETCAQVGQPGYNTHSARAGGVVAGMKSDAYPIRIMYDDQIWDVIDKVNHELARFNLRIEDDDQSHDGENFYRIVPLPVTVT